VSVTRWGWVASQSAARFTVGVLPLQLMIRRRSTHAFALPGGKSVYFNGLGGQAHRESESRLAGILHDSACVMQKTPDYGDSKRP
jgi:predicted Zn-dependent protease